MCGSFNGFAKFSMQTDAALKPSHKISLPTPTGRSACCGRFNRRHSMKKDLKGKKLGIIHAALITTRAVQRFIDEVIPEVEVVHWVDDTIQNTNFACEPGTIPRKNYAKFVQAALSQQEYGVDLILLACSTFNRAAEYARPMIDVPILQIDRPMMDLAVANGSRIGLLATVPTTVPASERLLRLAAEEAG